MKPKIIENITNLIDAMDCVKLLDDEQYLVDNDITKDEAEYFKSEIAEKIKYYEWEFASYMDYLSNKRQELSIQANWWMEEALRIWELARSYQKKVENVEKCMDFLMKSLGKEKLNTNIYALSYRKSESIEIQNENMIPQEFIKEKITTAPDKVAIKEAIKKWQEVPWATIITKQNLQIK